MRQSEATAGGRLENQVAVVTGGGGGIGAAICREFSRQGATIAVFDLNFEAAEQLADDCRRGGGRAAAYRCDVSHRQEVERSAEAVEDQLGPIEIWVNNAGLSRVVPFLECDEELWDLLLRINLTGTFLGCQAALRRMSMRGHGVILNMASQSGKVGSSQYAAYCASKFGVIGLTQSLALEFARQGIRVNALCPGVVDTALWQAQKEDYARKRNISPEEVLPYMVDKIPIGRLCTPEDVARTAVYLASSDAAYITGQALNVSGGSVMH